MTPREKLNVMYNLFLPIIQDKKNGTFSLNFSNDLHPAIEQLTDEEVKLILTIEVKFTHDSPHIQEVAKLFDRIIRKKTIFVYSYRYIPEWIVYVQIPSTRFHFIQTNSKIITILNQLNIAILVGISLTERTCIIGQIPEEKILYEKLTQFSTLDISSSLSRSNYFIDVFSDKYIIGDNFECLLFWSMIRSKIYSINVSTFDGLYQILHLPSPKLIEQILNREYPSGKISDKILAMKQYPDIERPIFNVSDETENQLNFNNAKYFPNWTFLTPMEKVEIRNDIFRFYENIYLVYCNEQSLLNILICLGLSEEGILMNFLLRDLYDPRLMMINSFSMSNNRYRVE